MFAFILLAMFSVTQAAAGEALLAPLPAHFVNEASHGENEYYRAVPDQRGLYAHGFADRLWSREFDGAPCVGSEAEQDLAIEALSADGMSEFWFYATRSQGILLTRTARFDAARPCLAALHFRYEVERAYVADGFIHSFSVDETNDAEPIGSWPISHSAGEYSGSFERIHSLMARPVARKRDRKQGMVTIAGVRATCRGMSGLVWSSVCVANSGPARGMILRARAGDDERMLFTTELKELRPGAMLPGILFEIDRSWTGKD